MDIESFISTMQINKFGYLSLCTVDNPRVERETETQHHECMFAHSQ
jgi:hypothetical protein